MKKKRHPMQPPNDVGDLFAVEFVDNVWGYCRIRLGGIEIPPVFTRTAGIPVTRWAPERAPLKLFSLNLFLKDIHLPRFVPVGNVPFASDDEAAMPPTYREPNNIEPRYTIEERGMYRYTSDPTDLKGITKEVWLTPAMIGQFLKQKYDEGELEEVEVKPSAT